MCTKQVLFPLAEVHLMTWKMVAYIRLEEGGWKMCTIHAILIWLLFQVVLNSSLLIQASVL